MPNSDPIPDVTVPKELIQKLIEAAPREFQKELLDALNNAAFTNRDDPIFGLVLFLELLGNYYSRLAQRVITSGRESDDRNREMIELLNERVRTLQGLEKGMQEAAARLDTADQHIVEAFPVNEMAAKIAARLEQGVKQLPLTEFENALVILKDTMSGTASQAEQTSSEVAQSLRRLDAAAVRINETNLPRLSIGWAVFWSILGAVITAGVGWFFVVSPMEAERPYMRQMANLLRSEKFIGQWVTAGYQDERPVLIISKDDIDTQGTNAQGDVTIWLKKK
jgi:hypothetical protein